MQAVAQFHHAFDALCGGDAQRGFAHQAVLTVVDLAIHHGVAVITHIRVCGDAVRQRLVLAQIGKLCCLIGAANGLYRFMQLVGQLQPLNGCDGEVLPRVLSAFRGRLSQNHLRVLDKIAVDGETIFILSEMYPIRLNFHGAIPPLKENDVGHHARTGVRLKSVVGQTNRAQQLCSLRDVFAHFRRLLVHGVAACYKGNNPAGANLIQRLGKKVIMDGKPQLVVGAVVDLILPERYIANGYIIEIASIRGFKARHGDVGAGIKLLCNAAGDRIQLHAVKTAVLHFLRQTAEKIADAHGGLQNITRFKAHSVQRIIDGMDNGGAGVVGVQRRCSGRGIFLRRKRNIQLLKLIRPVGLILIERIRQTAPADVFCEHCLFFRRCLSAVKLQFLQKIDRVHVCTEFRFCAADAKVIIGDAEILRVTINGNGYRWAVRGRFRYRGLI